MVHADKPRTQDTEAAGSQKQDGNNKATLASPENMEYVLFDKKKKKSRTSRIRELFKIS